jgi:hypothetical protein
MTVTRKDNKGLLVQRTTTTALHILHTSSTLVTMEQRRRASRGNDHTISYGGVTDEKSSGRPRGSRFHRKAGHKWSSTISLYTIVMVGIPSWTLLILCLLGTNMFTPAMQERTSFERVLHQDLTSQVTVETGSVASSFLPQRPRSVGFYFENTDSDSYVGFETNDPNVIRLHYRKGPSDMTLDAWERQKDLKNSRKYRHGKPDRFEHDDCVAQYNWQKTSNPTCNLLYEKDLTDLKEYMLSNQRLIANGYWRDVWKSFDPWSKSVLKTMRYEHEYVPRNYDRHRRDAVAMEQLTSSLNVVDIYGYCGNSGVFEFADGGDIDASLYNSDETEWSSKEKLVIAHQLVSGLTDTHNFAREGIAAIAHTDITTSQFVYVSEAGTFKLNDFNRCRFISFSEEKNATCTFQVGNNPGTVSSLFELCLPVASILLLTFLVCSSSDRQKSTHMKEKLKRLTSTLLEMCFMFF